MPNWNTVLNEIQGAVHPLDAVRRKYLKSLFNVRKRNIICYYSGFLQKPNLGGSEINDNDMNAFMETIYGLDRSKGLDLILHTPGGAVGPTEAIVTYLKKMFGNDITAIIPQIAMSAGTMIACSCNGIVMGKQSSLGPIDPHLNGASTIEVVKEFERAHKEIKEDSTKIAVWQFILSKYNPTYLNQCLKAEEWAKEIVQKWLESGMFKGKKEAKEMSIKVVEALLETDKNLSHSRHISIDTCKRIGLNIIDLESNQKFQDLTLTIHHSFMHTFSNTSAIKIVENHIGNAMVQHAQAN